jgi:hypothetical protein
MKEGLVTLKLGASHEFVLAYKFKSTNYYYDDEEEGALLLTNSAPKRLNLIQAFQMLKNKSSQRSSKITSTPN